MNKLTKIISYLSIFTVLLLTNCTKEKIVKETVYADKIHRWVKDSDMTGENEILLNSHADSNYILFEGMYLTRYDTNGLMEHSYKNNNDFDIFKKYPIGHYCYPVYERSTLRFMSLAYEYGNWANNQVDLDVIDTNFFDLQNEDKNHEIMIFNEQNQLLIPYYKKNFDSVNSSNFTNSRNNFLLLDFNEGDAKYGEILVNKINKIKINTNSYTDDIVNLCSFKNSFIIQYYNDVFKIKTDGTLIKVFDSPKNLIRKIFKDDNNVYLISEEGLFQSSDGENWNKIGESNTILNTLYFCEYTLINNEIIAYYNSQIFHIKIADNTLTVKEIDNDGLEGNTITSISRFKKLVYVTTLSGLFKLNYKDFYKYKQ